MAFPALQMGVKKTGIYDFADIDDDFISIHHFLKWYKFGMTRSFDNLSLEIRNGRLSRKDALQALLEIGDETPHSDIDKFCKFVDISKVKFLKYAKISGIKIYGLMTRNVGGSTTLSWTIGSGYEI